MKKIIVIVAALFFTVATYAQNDAFSIKVDGLGCPYCAFGLEKKMKEMDQVKTVNIDIETGTLEFDVPSSDALGLDDVFAQINKAGYTPVKGKVIRGDGEEEELEGEVKSKKRKKKGSGF